MPSLRFSPIDLVEHKSRLNWRFLVVQSNLGIGGCHFPCFREWSNICQYTVVIVEFLSSGAVFICSLGIIFGNFRQASFALMLNGKIDNAGPFTGNFQRVSHALSTSPHSSTASTTCLQVFPFPALLRVKIVSFTELSRTIPAFFRQDAIHGAM